MTAPESSASEIGGEHGGKHIPRATYRLQLTAEFNFDAVIDTLPYLAELGISHLYLSPVFKALAGSTHGYDTVDHSQLNPELGGEAGFIRLAAAAQRLGIGVLLDIVPNHMAAVAADNKWWRDVLEHGPASKYAQYFDIDWTPIRHNMRNRVLIPVLDDHYGVVLNSGAIQLSFDPTLGVFTVRYADHIFPLDPATYAFIFDAAGAVDTHCANDLQPLRAVCEQIPDRGDSRAERSAQRYRQADALKERLRALYRSNATVAHCIDATVRQLNGAAGAAASFDALSALLDRQPYRLAFWKVAGDEINYRRFFDVNHLAALRMDNRDVFDATHSRILHLVAAGHIQGLRIDHVDGLPDPLAYLRMLRAAVGEFDTGHCYIAVEKILAAHERLRDWPVQGTTGYEFGALIVGWMTAEGGLNQLERIYAQFVRRPQSFADTVYRCKRLLMRTSLAGEIAVLSVQLDRIAQAERDTRDFTQFALRDALVETIASLPVYRTYVSTGGVDAEDEHIIKWAVGAARARDKGADASIFDFLEAVLLCNRFSSDAMRSAALEFASKFQQVTAPVMAKSVEDTAFYRYCRLLSLNEVGSDPGTIKFSSHALHKENLERSRRWPFSLLATATHDSKRGEDVRYRLSALPELTALWRRFVVKAARLNRRAGIHTADGDAPSRNDEYLFLQTIVGIWPVAAEDLDPAALCARVKEYMIKATREAKERTSWLNPDPEYERCLMAFVDNCFLAPRFTAFAELVSGIVQPVAFFGAMNALTATVLKLTSPGVPDFYQGSELPSLTLVDPDNRRAIDFSAHRIHLKNIQAQLQSNGTLATIQALLPDWQDGGVKLFVTWRLLTWRAAHADLFARGDYEPLIVHGKHSEHVCAFARHYANQWLIVVVSRWTATITGGVTEPAVGKRYWSDTRVQLPNSLCNESALDIVSDTPVSMYAENDTALVNVGDVFSYLPVAVLFAERGDGSR